MAGYGRGKAPSWCLAREQGSGLFASAYLPELDFVPRAAHIPVQLRGKQLIPTRKREKLLLPPNGMNCCDTWYLQIHCRQFTFASQMRCELSVRGCVLWYHRVVHLLEIINKSELSLCLTLPNCLKS